MDNDFIVPPGWSGDAALYFFIGGLAGGVRFAASVLRLVERHTDVGLSRIGYCPTFPPTAIGVLLLTAGEKSALAGLGSLAFLAALTIVQALLFSDHPAASITLLFGVAIGLRMRHWRAIDWAVVSRKLAAEPRGRTLPVT